MPRLEKQSANGPKAGPPISAVAKTGTILDRLKPISQAIDTRISLLLYGRNRIGKSTLACMFPKPLALLSIEPTQTGGALSLSKIPGVSYEVIKTSQEIAEFAEAFQRPNPYKTVVLDSVSSWEKIVLQDVRGWAKPTEMLRFGKVSTDDYVERSERMRDAIRPFLELKNLNVIILANEKDHQPPKKEDAMKSSLIREAQSNSFFAADTGGGTARWLMDSCDYVVQMVMDGEYKETIITLPDGSKESVVEPTGKFIRRLRTNYHPNYAAGQRAAIDWSAAEPKQLPDFVDGNTPMELYNNFMKAIR